MNKWDKLPIAQRLMIWREEILRLKENDDPEVLRSFDFDELANDLLKAKKAIEEGKVAAYFKKLSWGGKVAFMQKIADRLDERAKGK